MLSLNTVTIDSNTAGSGGGGGISNGGDVAITGAELSGNMAGDGGGIVSGLGTVAINSSVLSDNRANGFGGAIFDNGDIAITDSTLERNSAGGSGGAISHFLGEMTLVAVTLADNSTNTGGAIYQGGGSLTVVNATLSGNHAFTTAGPFGPLPGLGGALEIVSGEANFVNATVASNIADDQGAAISRFGTAVIEVTNTVFADNVTSGSRNSCDTGISSLGHNIEDADTCGLTQPSDLTNTEGRVGPLLDNGGFTKTHALLAGSPAIDSGDEASCPTTDQRGVARPVDGDGDGSAVCDRGAYEAPAPAPSPGPMETPIVSPAPIRLPGTGSEEHGTGSLPAVLIVPPLAAGLVAVWFLKS